MPTATAARPVLVVDDRVIRDVVAVCPEDEPELGAAAAADGQEALS